jgi:glyoxylase-like metal-dependent hydrolase (beta-lactamase superfamily II)
LVVEIKTYYDGEIIEWKWSTDNSLLPRPYFTSCYFIGGLLIDTGAPASAEELCNYIENQLESKVEKCFITHNHEDHSGGAHLLQSKLQIPIYAGKKTISIIKNGYTYPDYRKLAWGDELLPTEAEIAVNSIITNNKKYKFEIFPMPGHCADLNALIDGNNQLAFVADAVLPKYKMIFGGTSSIQEEIKQIYSSIKNLYDFTEGMDNLRIFIAGHGEYKGREFLFDKLNEIKEMHEMVHVLLNKGYIIEEIINKMFGGEDLIGNMTQGELSIFNLIQSLMNWTI